MAMFPCPDCRKVISENAEKCPKCGRIIKPEDVTKWREESEKNKKKERKIGIILGAFIILIAVINIFIPQSKPASINQVISKVETIMSDFEDVSVYISSEDNNILCVDVTIEGTANGIAALKLLGLSGNWESWDELTTSSLNLCKNIKENVDDIGHKEIHVLYNIKNDINKDNILYSALDGTEIYNIKDD